MPPSPSISFVFFLFLISLSTNSANENEKKTFVVIVDPDFKPFPFPSHQHWYASLLSSSSHVIHVYKTLLHGFSASLNPNQTLRIKNSPGILTVLQDYVLHPRTTRSPSFLGLDPPFSRLSDLSRLGSDSIIGIIDTGIWPESPSFSDRGLGPVPHRWIGECDEGDRFNRSNCNRKLIGARYFSAGYSAAFRSIDGAIEFLSPRDSDGHGTHVASIAAGASVPGAEFNCFASGIARGMAPRARIAVYKVCWTSGCLVSDVVSAIEKAVLDGVDVLTISLGSSSPAPFYYLDPLAIGTFRAAMRGVFIAASAGNGGPFPGSVANAPPWITTVGSGTIDRDFPAIVRLGNGERLRGISISITAPRRTSLRGKLVISAIETNFTSLPIEGRIVVVDTNRHVSRIEAVAAFKQAGATAVILSHGDLDPKALLAEPHVLSAVAVGAPEMDLIKSYVKKSVDPTAEIFSDGTEILRPGIAPIVPSFSSRGPNAAVPWVLKPDLVAPGVNILGAWTGAIGPTGIESDYRRSGFNILSGTSMACPHVSGVSALIRAARPGWGPFEIRSALMTTAVTAPVGDESGEGNAGPFVMGAGYLNPDGAVDPGLVYDLEYEDHVGFLCGLKYRKEEIKVISGEGGVSCERFGGKGVWGFNYPAFVVEKEEVAGKGEVVFYRRLKRVDGGGKGCWYGAEVVGPDGYEVEVDPRRLWFEGRVGVRVQFRLVLRLGTGTNSSSRKDWWVGGMLRWREEGGRHTVASPVVVFSRVLMS